MASLLCVLALVAAAAGCDSGSRPLVATREGLVRGVADRSAAGDVFYSFKGIRYARPPVGPLRFQPPQRHPGWQGVADALEHGNFCRQRDFLRPSVTGDEDCLFANVYTPQLPRLSDKIGGLPVMVFIHGGGFVTGDGGSEWYGPKYLMDEAVVLVTFNYRLGVFGFFTTHDEHAPGNYGVRDQTLLLQWVQDNIGSFGGDPRAVTIFGESAGGSSVSLHVLSPLSKGLFHHAISQSGSSMANFAANGRRKGSAERWAKELGCFTEDVGKMVECVRNATAEDIMQAETYGPPEFSAPYLPRVDREAETPFLPDDPRTLLETGNFTLVPWMHGLVEEEGAIVAQYQLFNETLADILYSKDLTQWGRMADLTVDSESRILDCGASEVEQAARIHEFYTADGPLSAHNLLPLARLHSDRMFVNQISEEIRLVSAHTPVYKYFFNHSGPDALHFGQILGTESAGLGVTHLDDLMYLFSNGIQSPPPADSTAHTMIRFMVSLWASFARTGRPSTTVLPMPDWPVFTEKSQQHMHLNLQPTLGQRLFKERVQFWQSVPVNEPWRHAVEYGACPSSPPGQAEMGGYGG